MTTIVPTNIKNAFGLAVAFFQRVSSKPTMKNFAVPSLPQWCFNKSRKVNLQKKHTLPFQAEFWPAIPRQQIELESCSNPVTTSGFV